MLIRLPFARSGVVASDPETWPEVHVCESEDHEPREATHRAHLVTGPIEYCWTCMARVRRIYDALGASVFAEELPAAAVVKQVVGVVNRLTEGHDVDRS